MHQFPPAFTVALVLGLALSISASKTDPPPHIERPAPSLVQRGTTAELELRGRHLHPDSRAVVTDASGRQVEDIAIQVTAIARDRLALRVAVPSDVEAGRFELRVVAPTGASNAVDLHVCRLPVVRETEPNNAAAKAQELPIPAVVCGVIHAATEIDRLRFTASAGAHIVFDLRRPTPESPLDGAMTVLDARGRTIAWSRPTNAGGSRIEFHAANAGRFDLAIRDLQYRGGAGYAYHLIVGAPPPADPGLELDGTGQESESAAAASDPVAPPFAIRGCIGAASEVDSYAFTLDHATALLLTAASDGRASPLDPYLELCDVDGKRIQADDDGGPGNSASILRTLPPGRYLARVRSLLGDGSARHRYLLRVAPPAPARPDFALRFRPDAVRVSRGSRARLWCELERRGGFGGPVDIACTSLPRGVSIDGITLSASNGWTSVFTVHAADDAELGAHPVRLLARGLIDGTPVERTAQPEDTDRTPHLAWLTVLPAAPCVVEPVGPTPEPVRRRWQEERRELARILSTDSPRLRRELDEFRRAHHDGLHWVTLAPGKVTSAKGSQLRILDDGSVLVGDKPKGRDMFTLEFDAGKAPIAAIRLDALTHRSLPAGGPGWAKGNGNFVLSRLLVRAGPRGEPAASRALVLHRPQARFAQQGHPVQHALDDIQTTGWANHPESGRPNWLIVEPMAPISHPGGTALTVTLDQQFGHEHLLGRFRIAVAMRRVAPDGVVVPPAVRAALLVDQVTPSADLSAWFRGIAPCLDGVRTRMAELDSGHGHAPELARIEAQLRGVTPARAAAQSAWERELVGGQTDWTPLAWSAVRSERGVRFLREKDHVVRARRIVAPHDDYTLLAATELRRITALRLEAIPDESLPQHGPGLSSSGNFVLSGIGLSAAPANEPGAIAPVDLHAPIASFAQPGHPIDHTLDGKPDTGWAVSGNQGRTSFAMWRLRTPLDLGAAAHLRIQLEHRSPHPNHLLGRFRLSVTDAPRPGLGDEPLPDDVARALRIPAARRDAAQREVIAALYRDVAPELSALRERRDTLRTQQVSFPPTMRRGERCEFAVRVIRRQAFDGPLELTVEGFSSGRDNDRAPRGIAASFAVEAVALQPGQAIAVFKLRARSDCELGARAVVVRAEGRIAGRPAVEYSPPVMVSVRE